jgi:hypothetical protein
MGWGVGWGVMMLRNAMTPFLVYFLVPKHVFEITIFEIKFEIEIVFFRN